MRLKVLLHFNSGRLLHEACRFVGQSLFTSSEDRDHARMIFRLSEQAILTAKAGRLLASVSLPLDPFSAPPGLRSLRITEATHIRLVV